MSSSNLGLGWLAVGPGGVFVVGGACAVASVEVADEPVAERSECLVVEVTGSPPLVVELAAAGARCDRTECPLVDGVVETPVADTSGEHGVFLAGGDGER